MTKTVLVSWCYVCTQDNTFNLQPSFLMPVLGDPDQVRGAVLSKIRELAWKIDPETAVLPEMFQQGTQPNTIGEAYIWDFSYLPDEEVVLESHTITAAGTPVQDNVSTETI